MPLAALFIGGVLPAQLGSLIRKCAGYMKGIMIVCCKNCGANIVVHNYGGTRSAWKKFRFKYFKKYYTKFKSLKPSKWSVVNKIVERDFFKEKHYRLFDDKYNGRNELKNYYKLLTESRQKTYYNSII